MKSVVLKSRNDRRFAIGLLVVIAIPLMWYLYDRYREQVEAELQIQKTARVNVTWSWSWHGCGGESTQQIKFCRNQWRVIDAYIRRATAIDTPDGYESGDSATLTQPVDRQRHHPLRAGQWQGGGQAVSLEAIGRAVGRQI